MAVGSVLLDVPSYKR